MAYHNGTKQLLMTVMALKNQDSRTHMERTCEVVRSRLVEHFHLKLLRTHLNKENEKENE